MGLNPLRLADEADYYFEASDCTESVVRKIESEGSDNSRKGMLVLRLKNWQFRFLRIPNTKKYYFDLKIKEFEIEKVALEEIETSKIKLTQSSAKKHNPFTEGITGSPINQILPVENTAEEKFGNISTPKKDQNFLA